MKLQKLKWTKVKPKFHDNSEECLLIAAAKIGNVWEYTMYEMKKLNGENEKGEEGWYWGIIDQDGDEWGDYDDLLAQKYCILKP